MTRKTIKLIAPDKNGILDFQGECKLTIDARFSKALIVEPKNKDFLDICAFFRWKFIQKKNMLFVFAELKIQDFVLIFANEEICQKVGNTICRYKEEEDYIEEEQLLRRLLIPIFQKLPQNYSTRFKRIIIDWIEKHEDEEKMDLIKLYKKRNIPIMDVKNIKQEPNAQNPRKRRFSEMENNDGIENAQENIHSITPNSNAVRNENDDVNAKSKSKKGGLSSIKIIDESCFKIVNFKRGNAFHRKLLIFTSSEKTHCFEYNFYSKKQIFYHKCHQNANVLIAVLQLNENGNECIKLQVKPHICAALQYDPKNYVEIKIVKKPDYEILENCATRSKKMLIVFDSNNRKQCYEYYWRSCHKKFECCGCRLLNKTRAAEICNENSENEYIRLLNDEHVCEIRKFEPEKYPESNEYVLSPNFEIQKRIKGEKEIKTLIIFNGNDGKMGYYYHFKTSCNTFYCNGCTQKQKSVFAKIYQNDKGEDYVILSNVKHVCSPKEYIPQPKVLILRAPKIKFIETNETFKSKIIIFASNDNQMCYIFSQFRTENSKKYYCLGCNNLTKTKKEFCVYLCKDNDNSNEYYVKMANDQKHICKPQKYDYGKYETKILKPKDDYIFFQRNVKNYGYPGLAIYVLNDKSLCYNFCYKSRKYFQCSECKKKRTSITAKIQQDSDGNEYIVTNRMKHICNSIKVSSIIKSDTVILEKSGLTFEKEEPKKKKEINESRIIRTPNFELHQNERGVPERKLIVFCGDDKELCYEYKYEHTFVCKKCQITAKIQYDPKKNNEKYIILGPNEHSCEPVTYAAKIIQYEKRIVETSDFMIFNRDDKSKPTKLVIFTSSTKEFCYKYSFFQYQKSFYCCGCYASKKIVSAKLMKDSKNEEYIQLLTNDHVCEPKKFVLEEFQPKIITEAGFKLCANKNGKENSKLILFDSERDGYCYEYYLKNSSFVCSKCQQKKKNITARLCEKEDGERFLELSSNEHVCKSTEYDPEIYKENENIFGNFVVQHNISGDPNSRLTIFDENDKSFGYQFFLNDNYFRCLGCEINKKSTLVKLKIDAEGNQYLECINKTDHSCSIQNLKEKKLVFDDCKFKFEENANILVTYDPNQNDQFYKFKYDSSLGRFCCIKCKEEKKKIITATLCNGNDGKEFWLLNYKHFCIALSK